MVLALERFTEQYGKWHSSDVQTTEATLGKVFQQRQGQKGPAREAGEPRGHP